MIESIFKTKFNFTMKTFHILGCCQLILSHQFPLVIPPPFRAILVQFVSSYIYSFCFIDFDFIVESWLTQNFFMKCLEYNINLT